MDLDTALDIDIEAVTGMSDEEKEHGRKILEEGQRARQYARALEKAKIHSHEKLDKALKELGTLKSELPKRLIAWSLNGEHIQLLDHKRKIVEFEELVSDLKKGIELIEGEIQCCAGHIRKALLLSDRIRERAEAQKTVPER